LFYDGDPSDIQGNYTLYFWADRYPNGGQDLLITIPKKVITEQNWQKVYDKNNWLIFLKK
jgi:hypothetical protein